MGQKAIMTKLGKHKSQFKANEIRGYRMAMGQRSRIKIKTLTQIKWRQSELEGYDVIRINSSYVVRWPHGHGQVPRKEYSSIKYQGQDS